MHGKSQKGSFCDNKAVKHRQHHATEHLKAS